MPFSNFLDKYLEILTNLDKNVIKLFDLSLP